MYSYIYRQYCGNNPGGIVINPGYYALAEAILTNHRIYTIMRKWCDVVESLPEKLPPPTKKVMERKRRYRRVSPTKTEKIIALYRQNKKLKNREIAQIIGCTPEMVGRALHSIGVRRNRWTGHKSKDPRYQRRKEK